MKISKSFDGANIDVLKIEGNTAYLAPEQRDSEYFWFYWAFCVEDAKGETITFDFGEDNVIGYYGPAVSRDLATWEWLGKTDDRHKFTYTFESDEKIYFAHHMLYHPQRFFDFCEKRGMNVDTFCVSGKHRNIPCLKFGNGSKHVLLTARHHACESTGSYVLEGVLDELLKDIPDEIVVTCVPFIDYDGVIDGDQGKGRLPHDHNRDYGEGTLYSTTHRIKTNIEENGIYAGFDFHSPWHMYKENDAAFIVINEYNKLDEVKTFSELLKANLIENSFVYDGKDDIMPGVKWNKINDGKVMGFARFVMKQGAKLGFTLETAYFGREGNEFSEERALNLGRSFAKAIKKYL